MSSGKLVLTGAFDERKTSDFDGREDAQALSFSLTHRRCPWLTSEQRQEGQTDILVTDLPTDTTLLASKHHPLDLSSSFHFRIPQSSALSGLKLAHTRSLSITHNHASINTLRDLSQPCGRPSCCHASCFRSPPWPSPTGSSR